MSSAAPATGKRWRATASAWYLVEDGKVVDYWVNWDWLAIFEQIGALKWVHLAEVEAPVGGPSA